MHKSIQILLIACVAALCVPMTVAQEQKKADAKAVEVKPAAPEKPLNWYRVEIALHELEAGKRLNTRNYTLSIPDDYMRLELKSGSRVPIVTRKSQGGGVGTSTLEYFDLATNVSCIGSQRNGQLSLYTHVDWSSLAPSEEGADAAPVIRQLRADGVVVVSTMGKPILVSSLDDAVSKRRYQVEVTVTKQ